MRNPQRGGGLWQGAELYVPGRLEVRHAVPAEVDDVLLGDICGQLLRNKGLGGLARPDVRDADDAHLGIRRVVT